MNMKSFKTIIALAVAALAFTSVSHAQNPKASEKATVVCGNARFTVLTDRLIRMEWAGDGKFEDRASLAIVNRDLDVPSFTASKKAEGVTIKTKSVTLVYNGGGKFNADNLSVNFKMNGKAVKWAPGMEGKGNLKGTTRTLDRITGRSSKSTLSYLDRGSEGTTSPVELEDGILSRDGWVIVDESERHVLEKNDSDWGEWIAERPEGDRQDLYIFAYGHDYKAALKDFTKVAGNIPLPPKYTLGYWWSRYWVYTDKELLEIAAELREHNVPSDVFIIDMDWHLTWKKDGKHVFMDEFDQRRGWTGYTWNHMLIENPEGLLHDLHAMNYKTSLNLHPASGIQPYENCYNEFVKDYLSRTSDYDGPKDYVYGKNPYIFKGNDRSFAREGYRAPVPLRMSQQAWVDAYFNSVIRPLEKQGVDFWWLDWQQWIEDKYVSGLSNTFWLNWTFFNDKVRQSAYQGKDADRPLIYHRWGGLGSHRYQLGFSGDTLDEWSVLEILPYFTATASNVGYGYWGHDIGGHWQQAPHYTDPEMYTRWLQYGVFTPIFKTHSTRSEYLERKIWCYPSHYEYMKEAIELRYDLTPYIYDAARQAYESGVSMCRPLYYEYPEVQKAYDIDQEFFFGDNILATVLCQAMGADGKTERQMWFPAGNDWYDMAHFKMMKGGSNAKLYYTIDQNPWFVKAGAIIPMAAADIQDLQNGNDDLRILVIPGDGKSSYTTYQDDEMSQAYETDFAKTTITKQASGKYIKLSVAGRKGSFKGMKAERKYDVILAGVTKNPAKVHVNGKAVEYSCEPGRYGIEISLPAVAAETGATIEIWK